jgi:hypothetical protein
MLVTGRLTFPELLEVGTSRDTRCERADVDRGRIRERLVLRLRKRFLRMLPVFAYNFFTVVVYVLGLCFVSSSSKYKVCLSKSATKSRVLEAVGPRLNLQTTLRHPVYCHPRFLPGERSSIMLLTLARLR